MDLVTVANAAGRLGVSTRQVQHLVARGELRQLARGVLDRTSVERLRVIRGESHTRAWSEATAWGAVALLSKREAEWMGDSQRSRLKARLRALSPVELTERLRNRARVSRYAANSSTGDRLLEELVAADDRSGRLGLTRSNATDGYLPVAALDRVVARHGLIRDDEGRVTLRATTMDLAVVGDLARRNVVLAALDLTESLDIRERRAGLDAVGRAMKEFGG